jgi:MFS family permease
VDDTPRQHYGVTLAVLATGALAYAVSQTMVAPALPAIQKDLHTTTTGVTWVLTIYLLTASIATPVLGRLGDMFGKERVLVALDRDAGRRPRDPGLRGRRLPLGVRDHPRRVPT